MPEPLGLAEDSPHYTIVCSGDDRAQWLEQRRSTIGASDVPAILGVSDYGSPLSVYASKVSDVETEEDREESEVQKWGRIHEPHIVEEFAKEVQREVHHNKVLVRSIPYPHHSATIDFLQRCAKYAEPGNGEVKHTGYKWERWSDGVPFDVLVQFNAQLLVTGMSWGSVVVLLRGCKLLYDDQERDQRLIDDVILPECERFWWHVTNREPPPPDGSESARVALKKLYPTATPGKVVPLPASLCHWDEQLQVLTEARKLAEKNEQYAKQQLIAGIGDAEIGTLPNGVIYRYPEVHVKAHQRKESRYRKLTRVAPKEV